MTDELAYGSWPSPITAELVVAGAVGPRRVPGRRRRRVVVRAAARGGRSDRRRAASPGRRRRPRRAARRFSARTRVHEYGGGAWWLHDDTLFFVNWADQRLYRVDPDTEPGRFNSPRPLTPEPAEPMADRYADGSLTADGRWIVCVRERHVPGGEVRNELRRHRGPTWATSRWCWCRAPTSSPRPASAPTGSTCAGCSGTTPTCPGTAPSCGSADLVTGERLPGRLDPIGRRGSRRIDRAARVAPRRQPVVRVRPPAAGGTSAESVPIRRSKRHAGGDRRDRGRDRHPGLGLRPEPLRLPARRAGGRRLRRRRHRPPGRHRRRRRRRGSRPRRRHPHALHHHVVVVDLRPRHRHGRRLAVVRDRSSPSPTSRPTARRRSACSTHPAPSASTRPGSRRPSRSRCATSRRRHDPRRLLPAGPPRRPGPAGQLPPLVVMIHGGPTSAARAQLSLAVQFWTSRGFAVADVNYRGSTGYGRAYRRALNGQWGIADVDDCVAVAEHLVGRRAGSTRHRLAIRGGSAGGYTDALRPHLPRPVRGGREPLRRGRPRGPGPRHPQVRVPLPRLASSAPYPESRERYVERSPIHHTDRSRPPAHRPAGSGGRDRAAGPGRDDRRRARAKGVPCAYVAFEGEQHGFRQAPNIRRALEAELYFYGRVFGFDPWDAIEAVPIDNL